MKNILMMVTLVLSSVLLLSIGACSKDNGAGGEAQGSFSAQQGAEIYENSCLKCHGEGARGGICPDLTDDESKYGDSDEELYISIAEGRPGGMPGWKSSLNKDKINELIAYIRSLKGTNK